MEVATIKGATHNPGSPHNWTEANGPCGALPLIYRKDGHGNPECVSAWKPTADELRQLNEGGFVILSVIGWQVPVSMYTAGKDAAVATEDLLNDLLARRTGSDSVQFARDVDNEIARLTNLPHVDAKGNFTAIPKPPDTIYWTNVTTTARERLAAMWRDFQADSNALTAPPEAPNP